MSNHEQGRGHDLAGGVAVLPARGMAMEPAEVLRTLTEYVNGGKGPAGDILVLALFPPDGSAPEAPKTARARAISAGLMRALGECADGNRNTRGDLWIIARYVPNGHGYEIESFTDEAQAQARAREKNEQSRAAGGDPEAFGCFGPYHTSDGVKRKVKISRILVELEPEDPEPGEAPVAKRFRPLEFPGKRFDALFYSLSALEKFAVPYYARIHGAAYAERMRAAFLQDDLLLMGHLPNSEEEQVPPGGGDGLGLGGAPPRPRDRESLITVLRITNEGEWEEYQVQPPA